MNLRIVSTSLLLLSLVACDKLKPQTEAKSELTASASGAPTTPAGTVTVQHAAPTEQAPRPATSASTTVVTSNGRLGVQTNNAGASTTQFQTAGGHGTVQVDPKGPIKVQGPSGTVVVPTGAIPIPTVTQ